MDKKHLIHIFFLLLLSLQSYAQLSFEDAIFPELATSGRALAMGNAFIAKVDDASAAFYNPAGLGTVRFGHFHLSNLHMEFNKGWSDLALKGKLEDFSGNFSKGLSIDGHRQLFGKKTGWYHEFTLSCYSQFNNSFTLVLVTWPHVGLKQRWVREQMINLSTQVD